MKLGLMALMLAMLAGTMACGVKSYPMPMVYNNPAPITLNTRTTSEGVEVSFSIAAAERPDKAIRQVKIRYTYVSLNEEPGCPGCPPVLKNARAFELDGQPGRFVWLDNEAPYGLQAVYQAVVVDESGRESEPSRLAMGYVLKLPSAPDKLSVHTLEDSRVLSWQPVAPMDDLLFEKDSIGYLVERRLGGRIELLSSRPLSAASLRDYTANPSRTYRYRVIAARVIDDTVLVQGEAGPWVKAAPFGRASSLLPPENLVAVSVPHGIYLRFEPVSDPENRGYLLQRRQGTSEDNAWQALNTKPQAENTYIDTKVVSGQYYQYRVMAVDEEGDASDPGEAVTVIYMQQEEEL